MISGTCHLILGRIAIIDRMQANKGRTPFNIKIPRPSMMEDAKPIKILDRLEVIVEDNCVITKSVKDTMSMVVNVDTGTRSVTWNSFWKIFSRRDQFSMILSSIFTLRYVSSTYSCDAMSGLTYCYNSKFYFSKISQNKFLINDWFYMLLFFNRERKYESNFVSIWDKSRY